MKKKLFLFLILLCTVTFFTACSDDEDTDWQQIPKEEIKGDKATLQVNGETVSNGSVKFETKSAEQAVVTLSNVIIAYPEVAVDVTMEKQADGSYNFSGEKGMTTAPGTRATATPVIATVKVTGNITLDGKVKVEAATVVNDSKGWAGTYGLTAMERGEINSRSYLNGKIVEKKMTDFVSTACYSITEVDLPPVGSIRTDTILALSIEKFPLTIRRALGCVLPQVLKSVTLQSDGNIVASYSSNTVTFKPAWAALQISVTDADIASFAEGRTWLNSPKNLAYWFEKEGKLYVKLNISSIVAQVLSNGGQSNPVLAGAINTILSGSVSDIKTLLTGLAGTPGLEMVGMLADLKDETLTMLLDWIKNGVPLNVSTEGEHTYIYLDREALTPIIAELPAFIPTIKELNPMGMGGMLANILQGMSNGWKWSKEFNLGLDLKK